MINIYSSWYYSGINRHPIIKKERKKDPWTTLWEPWLCYRAGALSFLTFRCNLLLFRQKKRELHCPLYPILLILDLDLISSPHTQIKKRRKDVTYSTIRLHEQVCSHQFPSLFRATPCSFSSFLTSECRWTSERCVGGWFCMKCLD